MKDLEFPNIDQQSLYDKDQLIEAAKVHKADMERAFPGYEMSLQRAINSVLDAAIEYCQG